MPGGDRTGPMGFGPMSGRGMGWCGRSGGAGFYGPGRGAGGRMYGWGGGRGGRGWRNRFYATGVPGWARNTWGGPWGQQPPYPGMTDARSELQHLQQIASGLEQELAEIKARIIELENQQQARSPQS